MTLKIAIRNIFRHRVRSLITLSTIIFGCIALIFVGGFFEDLFWRLRESYIRAQTGHLQVHRLGYSEHGKMNPFNYLVDNPDEIKELLKSIPEIRVVTSRFNFYGLISTGDTTISFIGEGIEPENEWHITLERSKNLHELSKSPDAGLPVTELGFSLAKDDHKQVVLGRGLAEVMKARVGSPITLLTNTVNGSTNAMDVNVKGVFFTQSKDFDDVFLRLPLETAQKLLATRSVQTIIIRLHKTEDTAEVYEKVKKIFADKNLSLEVKRWEELADFYNKVVLLFDKFYWIMRFVIAIVVVLGIFNTLNMSVMERISEIGTMMALGGRPGNVMKLFFLEGLLLGTIGGGIGVVLGAGVVFMISSIGITMPPPPGATVAWLSQPKVVPAILISTFLISVVVGAISALFPAFKASRWRIVTALRYR